MDRSVLLLDENQERIAQIHRHLLAANIELFSAQNVQRAMSLLIAGEYDVIATHLSLENITLLLTTLLDLRQLKKTHLLIYPVQSSQERTSYLMQGVDVCLADCTPDECAAAILSLFRLLGVSPMGSIQSDDCMIHKELCIEPSRHRVLVKGNPIPLIATEFKILCFFAKNPGLVFTKDHIYNHLWGVDGQYGSDGIPRYIHMIRRKLGEYVDPHEYIKTIIGAGYCFCP